MQLGGQEEKEEGLESRKSREGSVQKGRDHHPRGIREVKEDERTAHWA